MNTVLSGAALAAVLALASPALAQAPSAPPSQPGSTNAATQGANQTQADPGTNPGMTSHKNKTHAAAHHSAKKHHAAEAHPMHRGTMARAGGGSSPTDNMANQLNQQEAQRLSGSSAPAMGSPNAAPNQSPAMQGQ
jgi:hypothetical protein